MVEVGPGSVEQDPSAVSHSRATTFPPFKGSKLSALKIMAARATRLGAMR